MPRLQRKNEHLLQSLRTGPGRACFADLELVHNCLPGIDYSDISLETVILGRTFRSPLYFNALTGGTALARRVNTGIALAARELGMPMAVGSQMAALEDHRTVSSFRVARRFNPHGEIWANIGSYASPLMARQAVEMIRADAVQVHLNSAQELFMKDGDNTFGGMLDRVRAIVNEVGVPVIAKEVGFGIAADEASALVGAGVRAIDVGGRGGSNFIRIECGRAGHDIPLDLADWGLPTAVSLLEVAATARGKIDIFAAGGMHQALDMARAIAAGAGAVGMAALPARLLLRQGLRALVDSVRQLERELRMIMMLVGVDSIDKLSRAPLVITGKTAQWLEQRGFDSTLYARRARAGKS